MTTCQICGRAIKAAKGVIAHHGYHRKGGWQTSSCFGARWRPWEIACDAIPAAITRASTVQAQHKEQLVALVGNPPRGIYYQRMDRWSKRPTPVGPAMSLLRPEGFDPAAKRPVAWSMADEPTYVRQFCRQREHHETTIKEIGEHIVELRERLASWKGAA